MFPIDLWNHFETGSNEEPKTTNCTEGYHNALQSLFNCSHPTVYKLLRGLEKDIATHRLTLTQANVGNNENQRPKYKRQAARLAEKIAKYDSVKDKLAYLRDVAFITATK